MSTRSNAMHIKRHMLSILGLEMRSGGGSYYPYRSKCQMRNKLAISSKTPMIDFVLSDTLMFFMFHAA